MTAALLLFGLWCVGFLFLFRIPLCRDDAAGREFPLFSVIIPARNEERNLPVLLGSLARQDISPSEVIVVDDGSTDQTARVAGDAGARVLSAKALPAGWRGKNWACFQGAEAAAGELLIFVDADTCFEDGGLRRLMNAYLDGRGVVSVGAYHDVERPYEQLSAFFNLVMTAGTGAFTIFGSRRKPSGLFGPFLMLDREAYFSVGGHAAVKGEILENFHLAGVFRRAKLRMRCYGGKGAFRMRMYPDGARSLIEGWSKAFASGAAQTPLPLLLMIVVWFMGCVTTPIFFVWGVCHWSLQAVVLPGILYGLFTIQIWSMLARIGSFRLCTSVLYPVPMVFYFCVFTRSVILVAFRKTVSWKGRQIDTASPGK